MTDGTPDPLNERARPFGRWATKAFGVVALITIGVVFGAKLGQPVKRVEQKVTAPIREVVKRTSPLEQLPDLVATSCPAIVALHVDGGPALPPQGVVLTPDGYILTTTALPAAAKIEAWFNDGQRLAVERTVHDPLTGLTLLKVDGEDLASLALTDPDLPAIGRWGALVSSPAGRGCMVEPATVASDFVTEGVSDDYYVRIHGPALLSSPGTPFLSSDGRILALARPNEDGAPGDRYLSADLITTVLAQLMRNTDPQPNPFGMIAEDPPAYLADRLGADRGRGATIVLVGKGSPADKAGLRVGDVILSAANLPVSSASELSRALGGDKAIPLVVSRAGEQATLTMTLTPAPPKEAIPTGRKARRLLP